MNRTTMGMALIALVLAGVAFIQGGFSRVGAGLLAGGLTFFRIMPILLLAFLLAGLTAVIIPRDTVSRYLGKEAGWKGPFWGTLMGAMVPGGPFFFYPLMATLIASGASVGTMISFVAAKTLWFIGRLPMEVALVGLELTLIRFVTTFALPILAGTLVNIFLPGTSEKIRQDVEERRLNPGRGKPDGGRRPA